jgi:hypothetical protein
MTSDQSRLFFIAKASDQDRLFSIITAGSLLVGLAVVLLRILSLRKFDPREPPVVPSAIPFAGHVIGIVRHGASYFKYLTSVRLPSPFPPF